jgi:hypothetical protein
LEEAKDNSQVQDLVDQAVVIGKASPTQDVKEGTHEVYHIAGIDVLRGESKDPHGNRQKAENFE